LDTEVTVPLAQFVLRPHVFLALDERMPDGPLLICGEHDFGWLVEFPEQDKERWLETLDAIIEHLNGHAATRT
jgi:hypothetical protein